jgi:hypothetical protein
MKGNLISALKMIGRPVAHYPNLSKVFNSSNVGVFLSQMLYWEGKQENEEGWIRKPMDEIETELGFGRYEMEGIRKKLKEFGVLEEKRMGMPSKMHYKIDWNAIEELVYKWHKGKTVVPVLTMEIQLPKVKTETIAFRMKEEYVLKRKEYLPEAEEYNFTKKDWNFVKLFKELFRKRILLKANDENHSVTDDEIFNSWVKFLDAIPDFYKEKQFYPSGLYSNFSAIEQSILERKKNDTSKSNTANTNKPNSNFLAAVSNKTE